MTVFYNLDGASYETNDPNEITRLTLSRSHFLKPPSQMTDEEKMGEDPTRFHPAGKSVEEVKKYLDSLAPENDPERQRVLGEERAGAARKGVLGDEG